MQKQENINWYNDGLWFLMTFLHNFFHKFRKNQLKKCIFDIFKGWRSWYIFERCSICSLGGIMYVFAKLGDQNIYRQMGSSHEYVLLYSIHSNTILSTILHNHSWSNSCWYRCSTNVECKMHISNSGKHIVNKGLWIIVFIVICRLNNILLYFPLRCFRLETDTPN